MADQPIDERLDDIEQTVQAALSLAQDPEAFLRALDAFRAEDAERFQSELSRADLLQHCHRICRWFCSKHCVFTCRKLAGPIEGDAEFDPKEALEFTRSVGAIGADRELVTALVAAADAVDAEAFQSLLKR